MCRFVEGLSQPPGKKKKNCVCKVKLKQEPLPTRKNILSLILHSCLDDLNWNRASRPSDLLAWLMTQKKNEFRCLVQSDVQLATKGCVSSSKIWALCFRVSPSKMQHYAKNYAWKVAICSTDLGYIWCPFPSLQTKYTSTRQKHNIFIASITTLQAINNKLYSKVLKLSYFNGTPIVLHSPISFVAGT